MLTEDSIREQIALNGGRGISISGLSNEDYHQGPGISSSDIKAVINGTIGSWLEDKKNPRKQTPALKLGGAVHCYVLEREQFWLRYCLPEDYPSAPPRNTKEGKDAFASWKEQQEPHVRTELDSYEWQIAFVKWKHPTFKKQVITKEELVICEGISNSIKNHPQIAMIFAEGESEVSLYWIDKETGLLCKCRPDRLNTTFPCIPDLKTCMDGGLDAFEGDITAMDYHVSAYWYLWGAQEVHGFDFQQFVYIPCEKEPPYQVTLYPADEGSVGVGEGLCRAGLIIFDEYYKNLKEGKPIWTGHSQDVKPAGIRPWAFNKLSQVINRHDLQGKGLEKFII